MTQSFRHVLLICLTLLISVWGFSALAMQAQTCEICVHGYQYQKGFHQKSYQYQKGFHQKSFQHQSSLKHQNNLEHQSSLELQNRYFDKGNDLPISRYGLGDGVDDQVATLSSPATEKISRLMTDWSDSDHLSPVEFHDNSAPSPELGTDRGYRWQLLQQVWERDFSPEYGLLIEFIVAISPSLLPQTVKAFPPQLNWPDFVGHGSLRCGGWKDSNLRFRFIQSA